MLINQPNRRDLIRGAAAGIVAATIPSARAVDGEGAAPEMIVRGRTPLNAETPVEELGSYLTPADRLFVRSHFGAPSAAANPDLKVEGLVKTPLSWTARDWSRLERVTLPAVLQCSGNGRGFYAPKVPGVGWERGAVGNAEWTGFRLKDLLEAAGIGEGVRHIQLLGSDAPPNPKTPAFHRSIPLDRAMDPSVLVAYRMNGEALPRFHGGPLRLIVPGWTANHWVKWLRTITPAADEAPGFYQRTGYRMLKAPLPAGATAKPENLVPVTTMNVKSLITSPAAGHRLAAGAVAIQGVAWTGMGRVTKLEVSVDGGPWAPAEFHGPDHEYAWRLWRFAWTPSPGRHVVRARATDSWGAVQPEVTPWNKSGYLWNGIDSVAFEVAR